MPYTQEQAWHDGRGHSYVQASLLGPSISLPSGKFKLGIWQQVVAINHDNHPCKRGVEGTIHEFDPAKLKPER